MGRFRFRHDRCEWLAVPSAAERDAPQLGVSSPSAGPGSGEDEARTPTRKGLLAPDEIGHGPPISLLQGQVTMLKTHKSLW